MRYLDGRAVDQLFARTNSSGTTAWYITDKLGTVEDVVSTGGTVLDHILYDSYGNITSQTNATNGDRFKFAGMEYDSRTGLYYDHARYYDPVTGRFLSQDPMGFEAGDTDLYRYVGNAPTSVTDPSGMEETPWWIDVLTWIAGPIINPVLPTVPQPAPPSNPNPPPPSTPPASPQPPPLQNEPGLPRWPRGEHGLNPPPQRGPQPN